VYDTGTIVTVVKDKASFAVSCLILLSLRPSLLPGGSNPLSPRSVGPEFFVTINIRTKITFVGVIFRRMHNINFGHAKFMRLCSVALKTEKI
jgi:hypothetical protein